MVAAGGDQVHAINLDAQAVISETVNDRMAGDAAGALDVEAGSISQKPGGITAGGRQRLQLLLTNNRSIQRWCIDQRRCSDIDCRNLRLFSNGGAVNQGSD